LKIATYKIICRFSVLIGYGMELLLAVLSICQGVISSIMTASGMGGQSALSLPGTIVTAIESVGFLDSIPLWIVSLLATDEAVREMQNKLLAVS